MKGVSAIEPKEWEGDHIIFGIASALLSLDKLKQIP